MPRLRSTTSTSKAVSDRAPLTDLLAHQHSALMRCELGASERLAETLVPVVFARLSVRFRSIDPRTRLHATHDAVLWYLQRPELYRPECARLDVFLGHVAECRLRDSLRREMRIRRREMGADKEVLQRIGDLKLHDRRAANGRRDLRRRLLILIRSRTERVFIDAYLRGASDSRLGRILRFGRESVETDREMTRRVIKRLHQRAIRTGFSPWKS